VVLYLVRHLQPEIENGICYGWSDVPTQTDDAAVKKVANDLGEVQAIHSSSLSRCRNLAQELASHLGLDVNIDEDLKELNFGDWEMKSWDDIGAQALDEWIASGYEATHSGEPLRDFDNRVSNWARGLDPHAAVAVVTHAGVIRSLLRTFGSFSLDESLALPIAFGEVIKFEIPA
jgi:alpha-ribazole phosphatase